MALFDFGKKKKDRVIDLGERYRKQQERAERIREDMMQTKSSSESQGNSGGMFSIFGGATPTVIPEPEMESSKTSTSPEERRKKLTRRLLDMTNKIEELSNQIYHLQQRIEVLERKVRVNDFE